MAKAILELEMPESCWQCEFCTSLGVCSILSRRNLKNGVKRSDIYAYAPYEGRHKDCPLKLVEGCEYCNAEPESVYKKDWTIFTKGEDKVVDINYCPMCGRRLEVEP